MSAPLYPASDVVSWNVTADGDYVVLHLPDNNLDLLLIPTDALDLGAGLQTAARDVIRESWGLGSDDDPEASRG